MQVNFQGAIAEAITDIFMINDGFSAGQKLAQLEKTIKKRFIYASDKEIHEGSQEMLKTDYYSDNQTTDEEFKEFTDKYEHNAK